MRLSGTWIDAAQPVMRALAAHHVLFVGGCLRNAILGLPIHDVDIATDATPDRVIKLAKDAGLRVIPTGLAHGTVTVLTATNSYEVTTFRRDVETDGRHAKVSFTTSLPQDAARRDFTMNALYADADGTVVDPLGGLPDLLARRLRFVGDADQRIREDYLRILRFFRFHAIYADHAFDVQALAAISANLAGLETLSRERVGHEMSKLLGADDPAPALQTMAATGVLLRILPGADARFIAPMVHFEDGAPCSWLGRLAILGGQDVQNALRLSRALADTVANLQAAIGSTDTAAALAWRFGPGFAKDALFARAATFQTAPPISWQADIMRGAAARFPISAADLMPQLTGPALGQKLAQAERTWLMSDLTLTRDDLLA